MVLRGRTSMLHVHVQLSITWHHTCFPVCVHGAIVPGTVLPARVSLCWFLWDRTHCRRVVQRCIAQAYTCVSPGSTAAATGCDDRVSVDGTARHSIAAPSVIPIVPQVGTLGCACRLHAVYRRSHAGKNKLCAVLYVNHARIIRLYVLRLWVQGTFVPLAQVCCEATSAALSPRSTVPRRQKPPHLRRRVGTR